MAFLRKEVRGDPGGPVMYLASEAAYERCIELLPDDALWHAGYAELYLIHYNLTQWQYPTDKSDLLHALDLLKRALEINPKTPKALEMLEEISYFETDYVQKSGDQFIFLYLTATPVLPTTFPTDTPALPSATPPPPTAFSTRTPVPSATIMVHLTATPMASPGTPLPTLAAYPAASPEAYPAEPQSRTGLCGSALFFPLLLLLTIGLHKRQHR